MEDAARRSLRSVRIGRFALLVSIEGELGTDAAGEVLSWLRRGRRRGLRYAVVDLTEATLVDSAAAARLSAAAEGLERDGGGLLVAAHDPQLVRLLRVVGLESNVREGSDASTAVAEAVVRATGLP